MSELYHLDILRGRARKRWGGGLGCLRGRTWDHRRHLPKGPVVRGDESGVFVAGGELIVMELCGLKVGLMICFDTRFPEVARSLARAGAELLVTISANMGPFANGHAMFCAAPALENGRPYVYMNQVGPGESLTFAGGSAVGSPNGKILAQAGLTREEVLSVRLPLPVRSSLREDYLSRLRPPTPSVRDVRSNAGPRMGVGRQSPAQRYKVRAGLKPPLRIAKEHAEVAESRISIVSNVLNMITKE